jgi:hypothetical protein
VLHSKTLINTGLLMLLLLAWFSGQVSAETAGQAVPDPTPTGAPGGKGDPIRKPVVARIAISSPEDIHALAARLDIWEAYPDHLIALLSPQEWDQLAGAGYQLTLDTPKTALVNRPLQLLPGQSAGIPGFLCYRTVEETLSDLSKLAWEHPKLVRWIDIGDSWEKTVPGGLPGYDLNVLILTNQNIPGPKPVFFLMAEIHARELVTAETATRLAEDLVRQYGHDPSITTLLDYYEIHVAPLTNPDGRKMAEAGHYWRKNTDNDDGCKDPSSWGTDLNRNSTFKWGGDTNYACEATYQGPAPGSEPETQAIQNYLLNIFPDQRGPADSDPAPATTSGAMITLHSYGRLVLWPWGWTAAASPNQAQLATLGRKLAYFNNYDPDQSFTLYRTTGTSDDFAYGELGVAAYTYEMGTYFFQDCASFENSIYPDNRESLLYAIQSARRPYQDPSGPDSIAVQVNPPAVLSGDSATLSATADDTRYKSGSGELSQAIAAARYSLEAPAWISSTTTSSMNPADGTFNASLEGITASLDTSSLPVGRHSVFVESQDADGNWGVPGASFLCVADDPYAPALSGLTTAREANPGEKVVFHLQLENLGPASDSYTLNLSGANWPTVLTGSPGNLAACGSAAIAVEVSIPADAFGGSSSQVTLTATSQGDPARSASLDLTTSVLLDYRIELTPEFSIVAASPGETITHTIQITNSGNYTATFAISLSDNLWPAGPLPPTIGLAPGEAMHLSVPIHIPLDAPLGSSDIARLRFQSLEFPEKRTTVLLTTHAWWRYYFPFVGG